MTRTSAVTVLGCVAIGALAAFLGEWMLVASGRLALVPPIPLGIVLAVIAGLLLAFAWPVRQAAHGEARVDFRHATSALGLAKASALVGALLTGAAAGALAFFATRPVLAGEAAAAVVVVAIGAGALLAAGLVAESWCALPPDDDDGATAPAQA